MLQQVRQLRTITTGGAEYGQDDLKEPSQKTIILFVLHTVKLNTLATRTS